MKHFTPYFALYIWKVPVSKQSYKTIAQWLNWHHQKKEERKETALAAKQPTEMAVFNFYLQQ